MFYLFRWCFKTYFRLTGWTLEGEIPPGVNKAVLVGGGHTSNWDLIFALGSMFTADRRFRFIIKKEAVVFPIKNFLLSLGAIPIDRRPKAKHNYVEQLARVFETSHECFLCIAPEGTRKAVKEWKTSFYHIAQRAQVPVIVCYLDYKKKVGHFGRLLPVSLSEEEAVRAMKEELKKAKPKIPKNFVL